MQRKVFGVVRVFLVLLKVQLGQKLAGLGDRVVYSPVVETLVRSVHLDDGESSSVSEGIHTDSASHFTNGAFTSTDAKYVLKASGCKRAMEGHQIRN